MENKLTRIKEVFQESLALKNKILQDESLLLTINDIASAIVEAYGKGKTVWWCGNGGSAADAQHLAAELSGRFYFDRPSLASEALHVNTSYITAVANDYSYDKIYSRYINGCGKEGDVLIGISTSGNSKNIINAMNVGKDKGLHIVALTGLGGGAMKDRADWLIEIPSNDTPRIQECHIVVGHLICELVESALFGDK